MKCYFRVSNCISIIDKKSPKCQTAFILDIRFFIGIRTQHFVSVMQNYTAQRFWCETNECFRNSAIITANKIFRCCTPLIKRNCGVSWCWLKKRFSRAGWLPESDDKCFWSEQSQEAWGIYCCLWFSISQRCSLVWIT